MLIFYIELEKVLIQPILNEQQYLSHKKVVNNYRK